MKKQIILLLVAVLMVAAVGCGSQTPGTEPTTETTETQSVEPAILTEEASALPEPVETKEPTQEAQPTEEAQDNEEDADEMRMVVNDGEHEIVFQLNDSEAAKELYDQLPLSIEVENYSSNEKIFYPPQTLDTDDAPGASGAIGSLAYYAPWDDVVMFYDSITPGDGLYELGEAISGSEDIEDLIPGTMEITKG